MRILIAVSQYHRRGGFPRHGTQYAVGFARRGHDVTVLTRTEPELEPADDGLRFLRYSTPGQGLLHMAVEPWVLTRRLRNITPEYDVVMAIGLPVLAPVVLVGTGTHLGYVREASAAWPEGSWRRRAEPLRPFHRIVLAWERRMLRGRWPRRIIVGADFARREYLDLYGFPEERVVVEPLGVEVGEFRFDPGARESVRRDLGVGPDTKVLLNIAGRGRQKGLDVLARMIPTLPTDVDWRFVFAGAGADRADLAGLGDRVRILGQVPDVRALYSAADLLVFPSRYDPWGLVVTEALACGLPGVVSRRAGSSIAIRPDANGAIVERPDDVSELREKVVSTWGRAFDRTDVAASVQWLSTDAMCRNVEAHLADVAAVGPPGASGARQ